MTAVVTPCELATDLIGCVIMSKAVSVHETGETAVSEHRVFYKPIGPIVAAKPLIIEMPRYPVGMPVVFVVGKRKPMLRVLHKEVIHITPIGASGIPEEERIDPGGIARSLQGDELQALCTPDEAELEDWSRSI